MEDMRLIGNINLHLKYLEMYESLKIENIEIEKKNGNACYGIRVFMFGRWWFLFLYPPPAILKF